MPGELLLRVCVQHLVKQVILHICAGSLLLHRLFFHCLIRNLSPQVRVVQMLLCISSAHLRHFYDTVNEGVLLMDYEVAICIKHA